MLKAARAEGVLSENTFVRRLELLSDGPLIDPGLLIGDLECRKRRRSFASVVGRVKAAGRQFLWQHAMAGASSTALLALDWDGSGEELVIGRNPSCDIVLPGPEVSRIHARLSFRDGSWILQDLGSTNGTIVNGAQVGRCRLHPGDRVLIGAEQLLVD
jgi:hypothetical protein